MRTRRWLVLLLLGTALSSRAYDFLAAFPIKWRPGDIQMDLQLDGTMPLFGGVLLDGKTSWNDVAEEALGAWNPYVNHVQFTTFTTTTRGNANGKNEVFFSPTVYGHRFGDRVLAVTSGWHIGAERVEGDTIFNSELNWDSYRGPINFDPLDLRRVAIHEFGHTLGLDHPDRARQVNVAIMNSIVSDLDTLADDDIRGARALYPPDERFALNVMVDPPGGGAVIASPAPGLDGKYGPDQVVTLTAKPSPRHRFNFWGANDSRTGRKFRVRPVDNEIIVADFSTNAAPRIILQPRSQFASFGERITLQVRAASATPATYQWQFNGGDLPDATGTALVLNFVTHDESGLYSCRVTNARGETSSKPARLVVDGY